MKIKIYNSMRKFSKDEIKEDIFYGDNSFYLGDNIDLCNCKPDQLMQAGTDRVHFMKDFGPNYIPGALECMSSTPKEVYFNRILLKNGIEYTKDANKLGKVMAGKMFMDFLKPNPIKKSYKITKEIIAVIGKEAQNKRIGEVVVGTFNPKKLVSVRFGSVNIHFIPRGVVELNL